MNTIKYYGISGLAAALLISGVGLSWQTSDANLAISHAEKSGALISLYSNAITSDVKRVTDNKSFWHLQDIAASIDKARLLSDGMGDVAQADAFGIAKEIHARGLAISVALSELSPFSERLNKGESLTYPEIQTIASKAVALDASVASFQLATSALRAKANNAFGIGLGLSLAGVLALGFLAFSIGSGSRSYSASISNDALTRKREIERLTREIRDITKGGSGTVSETVELGADFSVAINGLIAALRAKVASSENQLSEISREVGYLFNSMAGDSDSGSRLESVSKEWLSCAERVSAGGASLFNDYQSSAFIGKKAFDSIQEGVSMFGAMVDRSIESRNLVQATGKRIKGLGERATAIDDVVEWIRQIQTKLDILSMNTSIEVSRLPEDNGLTQISSEIISLATEAKDAVSRATSISSTIQSDIREANEAMNGSISSVVDGSILAESAGKSLSVADQAIGEIFNATKAIGDVSELHHAETSDLRRVAGEVENQVARGATLMNSVRETLKRVSSISSAARTS